MLECSARPGRRVRVLFVHYRDEARVGGSLRVEQSIVSNLDRSLFDPHLVFAYGGPGPVSQSTGAECHFIGAAGNRDFAAWSRVRKSVRRIEPDLIHYVEPVVWIRAALLGCGIRSLVHIHGPIFERRLKWRTNFLWRGFRRVSSGHVAITAQLRDAVLRLGWASAGRIWVVPNGIDVHHFTYLPSRSAARAGFDIPENAFVLGTVCRMVPEKGCQDAISALALLPARYFLLLAGDGSFRPALESLAQDLGVAGRVRFAGSLDDSRLAYAAMDAYLFTSREEPFGLVLAEAMAAGVPILGLAGSGGYRDADNPLITPANALLWERREQSEAHGPCSPETATALSAAIESAVADADGLRERTAAARAWVEQHFDASVQVRKLEQVYRTVLGIPATVPEVCAVS